MIQTYRASAYTLRREVEKWLKDHGFAEDHGGYTTYSREEWKAKGETMGRDATLTVISEGTLGRLWGNDPCCDREPLCDLLRLANGLGYYVELGYSWSMHFVTLD